MIAGMKSSSGNRLAQVYITDFGYTRIHHFPYRKYADKLLYPYFMDYGIIEQLHSDNAWDTTKGSKQKSILEEETGVNISQTDPNSSFKNNSEREIQQLQRLSLCQMK